MKKADWNDDGTVFFRPNSPLLAYLRRRFPQEKRLIDGSLRASQAIRLMHRAAQSLLDPIDLRLVLAYRDEALALALGCPIYHLSQTRALLARHVGRVPYEEEQNEEKSRDNEEAKKTVAPYDFSDTVNAVHFASLRPGLERALADRLLHDIRCLLPVQTADCPAKKTAVALSVPLRHLFPEAPAVMDFEEVHSRLSDYLLHRRRQLCHPGNPSIYLLEKDPLGLVLGCRALHPCDKRSRLRDHVYPYNEAARRMLRKMKRS